MKNRYIRFKYQKERVLLSDVLPYEVPLFFSNRAIYNFLLENKISINGKISFEKVRKNKETIKIICLLMFGGNKVLDENGQHNYSIDVFKYGCWTNPFVYKIEHKENEPRILSIPHPSNQLAVVDFYDKHKESIINYCNRSDFSIRKPNKIARYIIYKDLTNKINKTKEYSATEQSGKEYDNLRSFFTYKEYNNIYKFYESYKYQNSEKKFKSLIKLDISQCFDSIYTHSISWAVWGKELAKSHLKEERNKPSVPALFDKLMQSMNYGETNGILIGSEFSRIFSEVILQSIDVRIKDRLEKKDNNQLNHKVDYEIFRYVDDYFLFYNDERNKNIILNVMHDELREFKLKLNMSKSIVYNRPIITDLTIFKNNLNKVFKEEIKWKEVELDSNGEKITYFKYKVNSNKFKQEFKALVKSSGVKYQEILNYSLAVTKNKVEKILKDYIKNNRSDKKQETSIVNTLYNIIDFVFFIYINSPRVNTTIKLSHTIIMILKFIDDKSFDDMDRDLIKKKISNETKLVIKQNKVNKHSELETLYLLILLRELDYNYELTEDTLKNYLNIENNNSNNLDISYFLFIVSLFYIKKNSKYKKLKDIIVKNVYRKLENYKNYDNSGLTMMFFDFISCPYIHKATKKKLLRFHKIPNHLHDNIIDFKNKKGDMQIWFTDWNNSDTLKELDTKKKQEVY